MQERKRDDGFEDGSMHLRPDVESGLRGDLRFTRAIAKRSGC